MRSGLANPVFDYLPFKGGYDTETRVWNMPPGRLREAQNYEVGINGQGYIDIEGYEIFDGQTSPSSGAYAILDVTITGSFAVGNTITQLVSGATGVVLAVVTSTTPDYLVITKITGTFNATNDLQVAAATQGTALSVAKNSGASTSKLHAQYLNLAADEYRGDISAVPGSGAVLGLHALSDIWYAFRNNSGGSAVDLYKSSASGWTQVALGFELAFTSGGTAYTPSEGDEIEGEVSGAKATLTRIMLEDGSWDGGDAVGKFIFASQSGTFQSETVKVGANLDVAAIAADSSAITLSTGGRFEMTVANFGGNSGASRIYGCDGANRGFEFDGSIFCPIDTGMAVDTPKHCIVHKNHLFFSFDGSAQHSGIGLPYIFSPIFGAAELATGDEIVGFKSEPGAAGNATLGIYNSNVTHMLYGTSALDWNLVRYREELGAFPYTIQQFGQTIFLDDRGITTLSTTLAYGNFQQATVSRHIQRFLNTKRVLAQASCISRDKNQYRLFFSDKTGLYLTIEGSKIVGIMPILFNDIVSVCTSLEDSTGAEVMMFGSTDGKVYQMDKGTSFDGDAIEAYLKVHYHYSQLLRWLKKYMGATMELEGDGYAEFNFSYELGYGSTDIPQPGTSLEEVPFRSTVWDAFIWEAFVWDGKTLAPSNVKLGGSAENISIIITKSSDYFFPVNFSGVYLRFTKRRQLR